MQYKIQHTHPDLFIPGEKVFLLSNPEMMLIVDSISIKEVVVRQINGTEKYFFPPECLLQYVYAALVVYKNKYDVCLN